MRGLFALYVSFFHFVTFSLNNLSDCKKRLFVFTLIL